MNESPALAGAEHTSDMLLSTDMLPHTGQCPLVFILRCYIFFHIISWLTRGLFIFSCLFVAKLPLSLVFLCLCKTL